MSFLKKPTGAAAPQGEQLNPYLSGRKEWEERFAQPVKEANSWKMVAVGTTAVALAAVVGLGVVASQSKLIPYVVQVDKLGTVLPVARADQAARPDSPVVRAQLGNWISNIRSVYLDAAAVNRNVFAGFALIEQNSPAFQVVSEHMKANDPFRRAQRETVSVEVEQVLPVGGNTWRVEWRETVRGRDGQLIKQEQWSAVITTTINPPTDEATILVNPLGVYVSALSWSQRV